MDYEPLSNTNTASENAPPNRAKGDDFSTMLIDLMQKINFKVAIFLFLWGIFIFSDLFIEIILNRFQGATDGLEATTKGTVIQLVFLSIGYIILDLLIQGGFL